MGLEHNNEQHYREVPDKFVDPAVSYQMKTKDYVVRPAPGQGGVVVITLPPVSEAEGRFYSILLRGAGTVIITDYLDSECWADITLDAACEKALLYSDGLCWLASTNGTVGNPRTFPATTVAPTTGIIG